MSIQRASPENYFAELEHSFTIGSEPFVGLPFKLDGVQYATPFHGKTLQPVKTLEAYPEVVYDGTVYMFKQWGDGVRSLKRTVNLEEKTNYVMTYEFKPEVPKEEVKEAPTVIVQRAGEYRAQETLPEETTLQKYMPVIIVGMFVLGIVAICYLATVGRK